MRGLLLSLLILSFAAAALAQAPWERHGKLEVSKNGHYVQHRDGTPFLWMGDTAWGMFQQLKREDVELYLANRKKLGFNVIQSVALWYPHGGGIDNGPHNAANAYGHRPFRGTDQEPDTSQPLIVPGGSPDAPNDFWDHADYVVAAVRRHEMYLALLPCWGRAYITAQQGGAPPEINESEARIFGAFIGERYAREPHVLWVLGGDAKAQIKGLDKYNVYQEWDKRAAFRAMAEGILRGATGKNAAWNEPNPAWREIFMTYHPDGDPFDNSSKWFHGDAWLTVNGVEVWKEIDKVYPVMAAEYRLADPVKPSLFLEGSYEFGSYRNECGWVTPVKVRRQVYHTFFAGGAGHTYGAGPIWAMRGTGGDYNCGYTWKQALDFPAGINFAGLTQAFLRENEWFRWIPDTAVIERGAGDGELLKTAVMTDDGTASLVYFAGNSFARIKNKLAKPAMAEWFDPRSGKKEPAGTFAAAESRDVAPPLNWEDAILILRINTK